MGSHQDGIEKALIQKGYIVLKKGWPDFLVMTKDFNYGFAIEAKAPGDNVKPHQQEMHKALARFGLRVHIAKVQSDLAIRQNRLISEQRAASLLGRISVMEKELANLHRKLKEYRDSLAEAQILLGGPSEEIFDTEFYSEEMRQFMADMEPFKAVPFPVNGKKEQKTQDKSDGDDGPPAGAMALMIKNL